jgi:phosphoenolpyruvate phosphomutase
MKLDKNKILRNYLNSGKLIRAVGAHDGLSAKLIGEAGFETVWASGLEISTSFGVPDANILTMTQFLSRAAQMNQSTSLPIIADCDTGFGNVNNAIHMAEQYESHGISAVCIEDKQFPKVNSFIKGRQDLADISEFVGKIKAIKNTQKDKNLILISRIEALIAGWGMEEALKRGFSYADAGSDAILIHSKNKSPEEIKEFIKEFRKKKNTPIVLVPTTYIEFNEAEMQKLGVNIVIYANHVLRSRIKSQKEILNVLSKDKKLKNVEKMIAPLKDALQLSGLYEMTENEKLYSNQKLNNIKAIIPAAGEPLNIVKKEISKDPTCLLKFNNDRLIDRTINILNSLKIKNHTIVTGYKNKKFDGIDSNKIYNKDFIKSSQMHSIDLALDYKDNSSLIIFSDVIFEKHLIERLITSEEDITFLINPINKNFFNTYSDKVIAKNSVKNDGRFLTNHKLNEVLKIGKNLSPDKANYEYTGICYLSKKGINIVKDAFAELKRKKIKNDFISLFNFIIEKKISKVSAIEINGGWIEVRDKKNYQIAKTFL